jgi:DNA-3-methyladenine glycosylase II
MFTTERNLHITPPFDFQQSLKFLGLFSPTDQEQTLSEQSLTKALRLGDQTVAFRVESKGTPEKPELHCTLFAPELLDQAAQKAIEQRAAFYLSLDDDLQPFYALAEDDPHFAPVVQALYGYHQVKFLTPFENACWAILTARNRMSVARKVKDQIVALVGSTISIEGMVYPAFPEPTDILKADTAQLTNVVGNLRRVEYMLDAARAFASADETWLRTGDYDEVEAWLRDIKGIGEWSASFILIRALGRMERLTAPEKNLVEAASRLYKQTLTAEDVIKLAQGYGAYPAYWAHYVRAVS